MKKIAIASDHAGYTLKKEIIQYLQNKNYKVLDLGTHSEESTDYPDYGHKLAEVFEKQEADYGFSLCGSGNGINMTVNKHPKIRAALCWNSEISKLARLHNNAMICSLPARFLTKEEAFEIVDVFLNTGFEGGRHERRIKKIPVE